MGIYKPAIAGDHAMIDKLANDVEQTAAANPDRLSVFNGFNCYSAVLGDIEGLYRSPAGSHAAGDVHPLKSGTGRSRRCT